MATGYRGTYVLPWSETSVNGTRGADLSAVQTGTTWEWSGTPRRIDGVDGVLTLCNALNQPSLREHAARTVQKLFRRRIKKDISHTTRPDEVARQIPLTSSGFVVTNGTQVHEVTLLEYGNGSLPLVIFSQGLPPKGQPLQVRRVWRRPVPQDRVHYDPPGMAAGTLIETPEGKVPVECLYPGDLVCTAGGEALPILWIGAQRISQMRLKSFPHLRPLRVAQRGWLGGPMGLTVAPGQQIAVTSPVMERLFNCPTGLLRMSDVADEVTVETLPPDRAVDYLTLVLPRQAILRAGGARLVSFHPQDIDQLPPQVQGDLHAALHDQHIRLRDYPQSPYRVLSQPETAIVCHRAA